ncbi:hypothetical protein ABMA28_014783 [Loxostege sticticalis]|uniref:C2H2-type domain-containing protein n=1 Tax=Loxostege sticticalis TaxID=481309 RepID=A0ABD0TC79_LOXSC
MNFAPFTGHIPTAAAIPTIHQFAAKFGYEGGGNSTGVVQETRYQGGGGVQFAVAPGVVDGVKFRQAESVVVVSSAQPAAVLAAMPTIHTVNTGVKYQTISASTSSVNLGNITYGGQTSYVQAETVQQLKEQRADKREYREELTHDLMATMMQQHQGESFVTQATPLQQGTQQLLVVLHEPKEAAALARAIKQESRADRSAAAAPAEFISIGDVTDSSTWQTLGGGVADYLSALPLPLHHLLKYSTPATSDGKREDQPTIVTVATNALPSMSTIATQMPTNAVNSVVVQTATIVNQAVATTPESPPPPKKKKKKKSTKEKTPRPKPGEIRLTTALDGSTLYCCPECHMAYPERELLEQHLVGHTMERRFICDICNAALKRKDHLTRHKQSHNPERPHVCSVCLKAFKRKEQLTLHFVIHSGEKRHVCNECGKGFYRKDHLRKHTRSHIARRVKAELSAGAAAAESASPIESADAPAAS